MDPEAARTVVHEIRAHRRGPAASNGSSEKTSSGASPPIWTKGEELDQMFGILPNRRPDVANQRNTLNPIALESEY